MPEYFRADSGFVIDCFNRFNFFYRLCYWSRMLGSGISHEFGTSVTSFSNNERGSKISNRFALKTATVALVCNYLY